MTGKTRKTSGVRLRAMTGGYSSLVMPPGVQVRGTKPLEREGDIPEKRVASGIGVGNRYPNLCRQTPPPQAYRECLLF